MHKFPRTSKATRYTEPTLRTKYTVAEERDTENFLHDEKGESPTA